MKNANHQNAVSQKSLYTDNQIRSSFKTAETQPGFKSDRRIQFEDQTISEDPNFMVDLLPSAVNASFTNQLTGSPIKDNLYALENNFYAPVHEDASASAKAKIKDL